MPFFITGDMRHALRIVPAMLGFNGIGSLEVYLLATSQMTLAFTLVAVAWLLLLAGRLNLRFYAGAQQGYWMQRRRAEHAGAVGRLRPVTEPPGRQLLSPFLLPVLGGCHVIPRHEFGKQGQRRPVHPVAGRHAALLHPGWSRYAPRNRPRPPRSS